jgi:hypothetical protein
MQMSPAAIRKNITICFLLLVSQMSVAQFKNIKLDEKTDGDYVCEPSIAINSKNVNNIVAASVLNNIYVTNDGGLSWKKQDLQSPLGVYGDPALIADPSGNFHFFHLSDPTLGKGDYDSEKLDRIVSHVSSDNGETWSEGSSIGLNTPKDQDKPWPGVDSKGNVYVAWTQFDKYGDKSPDCKSVILLSESRSGKKWSEPLVISQVNGDCVDGDNTVMGGMPASVDGKSFVVWAHDSKIFMDRSYDGKMWLSNDIRVTDQVGGWDLKIPGHDRSNGLPVFLADRSKTQSYGYLHMVWADQRNGADNTDIWYVRSGNFGDNWTSPFKINGDDTKTHQYMPWMAVDQTTGFIYIVFYDRREHDDMQTDVYLAWSVDAGSSFKNVKISESSFVPDDKEFFGDYTNIAAHKGIITPIWTRMENGKTSIWTAVIKHSELDNLK